MKTKQTFLTFLMLFSLAFSYAQTSIDASGIAIQGIARDNNNTARINTQINLNFKLYYIDANTNTEEQIGPSPTPTLTTDNFGVFSYVLVPGATNNTKMANNQVYLRISEGSTVISDEELRHVPYAISANNGVPAGSIMPFVGNAIPTGWVLCNGQSLTGINGAENLIALVGNNAPDLRGMFLRGAGSNNVSGYNSNSGPALNTRQQDANLSHLHSVNLTTASNGNHSHTTGFNNVNVAFGATGANPTAHTIGTATAGVSTKTTTVAGTHSHNVSGNTAEQGSESRPVNYGVNYIIKL